MWNKNKINYLLSFLIPLGIIVFVLLSFRVFIKYNLLIGDSKAQYISFFAYYKNMDFSFYSFSNSLGSNMIGLFAYYLASPLNLLLLLVPKENLDIGLSILMILKLSLCGLTMFTFLKYKIRNLNPNLILIFSTSYALMGYLVGYYFHVMWLDGVILLPLILLGIEKLIKEKKSWLYCVCLFLAIVSNYYIAYMCCIFIVIYFVRELLVSYNFKKDKKEIIQLIKKFSILSILTGLCSCFLLYPMFLQLSQTVKTNVSLFGNHVFTFSSITDFLSRFFINSSIYSDNITLLLNKNLPLMYCGTLVIIMNFVYFFDKKIKRKEKTIDLSIILVFLISFSVNFFNNIWHGFNYPLCFNQRYSFIFCLFLIFIACKEISKMEDKRGLFIYSIVTIIILPILYISNSLPLHSIILTIVYSILYIVILVNIKKDKKMILMLFALAVSELTLNLSLTFNFISLSTTEQYSDFVNVYSENVEEIVSKDDSFYRIGKRNVYSYNDSYIINYNDLTTFSSLTTKDVINFFNNCGYTSSMNVVNYINSTLITDSLLNVKYWLLRNMKHDEYEMIDSFKFSTVDDPIFYNYEKTDVNVYKNQYALSIGFAVRDSIYNFGSKFIKSNNIDPLNYQNNLVKSMIDNYDSDYLIKINNLEKIEESKKYEFINNSTSDFYLWNKFFLDAPQFTNIEVKINGELITNIHSNFFGLVKVKNKYKIGEKVTITYESDDKHYNIEPYIYYFDYENFKNAYRNLSQNQLDIISYKDGYLKGAINIDDEKRTLLLTIPYDSGFTVYVDGKKAKINKVFDIFMATDLEKGNHEIVLKYSLPGKKSGIIISVISMALLIGYLINNEKLRKNKEKM